MYKDTYTSWGNHSTIQGRIFDKFKEVLEEQNDGEEQPFEEVGVDEEYFDSSKAQVS